MVARRDFGSHLRPEQLRVAPSDDVGFRHAERAGVRAVHLDVAAPDVLDEHIVARGLEDRPLTGFARSVLGDCPLQAGHVLLQPADLGSQFSNQGVALRIVGGVGRWRAHAPADQGDAKLLGHQREESLDQAGVERQLPPGHGHQPKRPAGGPDRGHRRHGGAAGPQPPLQGPRANGARQILNLGGQHEGSASEQIVGAARPRRAWQPHDHGIGLEGLDHVVAGHPTGLGPFRELTQPDAERRNRVEFHAPESLPDVPAVSS